VICPWTIYQVYGDRRLLAERYDGMARWVEYLRKHSADLLRPAAGYGDWLSIKADTPKDVLATAYFARSADLVSRAAQALGKDEDARKYAQLFQDIRAAFNRAYVSPDGRIKGDTQTVYVLALHFGLLPDALREGAARRLVADIAAKKGHLSTGFVGVGYLCPTLTETGHTDVAYRLLQNDTFPSWGYSIRQGATTIWERWDGWTEERGFQDPGMNSFNHYSLGSVGEWLFASVAGIDTAPDQPAFKHIVIRPHVTQNGLTHAKAEYDSIHGTIATDWRRENGAFTLRVRVPANTTATVYVPARDANAVREGRTAAGQAEGVTYKRQEDGCAVYEIGSGEYVFRSA
jgi:alpha-L-rhamnosidase